MLFQRIIRAARMDTGLYQEAKRRPTLTREAATVILLTSIVGGVTFSLATLFDEPSFGRAMGGLLTGVLSSLLGWVVLFFLCYHIGSTFFGGKTSYERFLRTLGYASAPRLLRILAAIPIVGWAFGVIVWLWCLATSTAAIQEALNIESGPAFIVSLIGWAGFALCSIVLAAAAGLGPIMWRVVMPF